MTNILKLTIFLSTLLTSLLAGNTYVKVDSVQNSGLLFNLTYELKERGYKVYTTQKDGWYTVYTGPFQNSSKANKAVVEIKKNISRDAVIINVSKDKKNTLHSNKKKLSAQSNQPTPTDEEKFENLYRETRFFVGLSLGLSMFKVEDKDLVGEIVLDTYPMNAGYTYGAEVGYFFINDVFITLNYQHSALENVYFDSMYTSLNYKFNNLRVVYPYIGIIGGYNIMEWTTYPVDTIKKQENSSSFFMGFQLGNDIPITNNINVSIFYKYLKLSNETEIDILPDKKVIKHNSEQNINIAIRYNF